MGTLSNFRITEKNQAHTAWSQDVSLFIFLEIILRESLPMIYWKENRNIKIVLHKNYENKTPSSS